MQVHETTHAENHGGIEEPTYRVNFWSQGRDTWALEAFVVTGAVDVTAVLGWIDENHRGRRVEVFAEMAAEPVRPGVPRSVGLVRLLGENPVPGVSVAFGDMVSTE